MWCNIASIKIIMYNSGLSADKGRLVFFAIPALQQAGRPLKI
jgi:hypothetical protein